MALKHVFHTTGKQARISSKSFLITDICGMRENCLLDVFFSYYSQQCHNSAWYWGLIRSRSQQIHLSSVKYLCSIQYLIQACDVAEQHLKTCESVTVSHSMLWDCSGWILGPLKGSGAWTPEERFVHVKVKCINLVDSEMKIKKLDLWRTLCSCKQQCFP